MARRTLSLVCQNCGAVYGRWQGKCESCGSRRNHTADPAMQKPDPTPAVRRRKSLANLLLGMPAVAILAGVSAGAVWMIQQLQLLRCPTGTFLSASGQGATTVQFIPCLSGCLTNPAAGAIFSTMDTTFPTSLPKFQRVFPNDGTCARYLEAIRWPHGFSCPKCNIVGEPYRFATRSSVVLRCRACKKNTSLTAGTVMQSSHMPLSTWFWGAYLMTTQTPGQSAVQFQRQLEIATYETAFAMLHKLRAGMVRPGRDTIGAPHPVEVDECYVGGRTRGEGKGIHHQTTVVGAVEVRTRKDADDLAAKWKDAHEGGIPVRKLTYAGRLRL